MRISDWSSDVCSSDLGLKENFPSRDDYDFEELKRRFLYTQAMETARCLEEGVLTTPEDADLGSIYGWGFPAWTGGTISYIDTVGIQNFVREADTLEIGRASCRERVCQYV